MGEMLQIGGIRVPIGTHEGKKIIIGSDHRGFELKEFLKIKLGENVVDYLDVGTFDHQRTDYPLFSYTIAMRIAEDADFNTVGVAVCGSGIGMAIPGGKLPGVYAARCLSVEDSKSSRQHNNSNMLTLSADQTGLALAVEIFFTWLKTPFYSDAQNHRPYLERFVQTAKLEMGHIRDAYLAPR